MRVRNLISIAALAIVTACGGQDPDERFTTLVSFGDSLSDVGSYRTPAIAAIGGGQYTVNGAPIGGTPAITWTELMAATLESLRHHRIVIWGKHGVMARSDISAKRAADRIGLRDAGGTARRHLDG